MFSGNKTRVKLALMPRASSSDLDIVGVRQSREYDVLRWIKRATSDPCEADTLEKG